MSSYRCLNLFALIALCIPSRGELPVHCLGSNTVGTWRFVLSAPSELRPSCGHSHPDDPLQEPRPDWAHTPEGGFLVTLSLPASARLEGEDAVGSWAVVGDEGFEVRIGGRQFFAFFGFQQLPVDIGSEHLPLALQERYSRCGVTMLGWWRSEDRKQWGCYSASKQQDSFLQHGARIGRNSRMGFLAASSSRSKEVQHVQGLRAEQTDLPISWDWRNVSGHSWVDSAVWQGLCGSCQTIATVHMLAARHRIATRDPQKPGFSISFPLFCAEYNQGCAAGFPFLVAKWSEDVGLIPERCAPTYNADGGSCSTTCDPKALPDEDRLRAANHRYLGGYIGAADASTIMDELVSNGPAVVSFRSDHDLQEYKGGLFNFAADIDEDGANEVDFMARPQGFVGATHSALLIGFGVTPAGEKYWILQNSWGSEWGEQGTFRILQDEAKHRGLEAMVVVADVVSDGPDDSSDSRHWVLDDFVTSLSATKIQEVSGVSSMIQTAASESAFSQAHAYENSAPNEDQSSTSQPLARDGLEVLCRASGDPDLVVKIDRVNNVRGISLGDSVGTETKVTCKDRLDSDSCPVPGDGNCASAALCPCDLRGAALAYAGMEAVVDKVALMCKASATPMNVLMIGLGGGAIPSAILDRCPDGQVSVDSVELDARVADVATKFFGFVTSSINTVEITDGLSAVRARSSRAYDVVLVDCFGSSDRVPEGCRSHDFLEEVHRILKDEGVLMQNVWARSAASADVPGDFNALWSIYASTFQGTPREEVVTDVPQSKEEILYGIKGNKWGVLFADI